MTTPWWRPDRFLRKQKHLLFRAEMMKLTRAFFDEQRFTEVDTPMLQFSPCMEPHLFAFGTDYVTPRGETHRLYLGTSPEFQCKKLLVAGMERIYQLSHVFRNREGSSRHHPEFALLEWYRVGAGYDELMKDCEGLMRRMAEMRGKPTCHYNQKPCDLTRAPERLTVADAFARFCSIDLLATMEGAFDAPNPARIMAEAKKRGVHVAADDTWDDVVLRILGEKIEPHLGVGAPTFLMDYPISMAALSKPHASDARLAQRFELYVAGLELANAFVELTDPKIQRVRFEADMALRKARYGEAYPVEEDFLAALEHGLPDCAGIALGFDRLVMLGAGTDNIDDVLWAPVPFVSGS